MRRALAGASVVAALALVGCGREVDDDFDGFVADEDCDDADPFVYPGAADPPGDGLDADCDGEDPEPAYFGDWVLEDFGATTFGVAIFVPDSASGSMSVSPDLTATIDMAATLDPLIVGFELEIAFSLDGVVSSVPDPHVMAFYAEGILYDELVHVDWECAAYEADVLDCAGEVKALESSLAGIARFTRR